MIPILPNNPSTNVSNLWVWGFNDGYRTGLGINTGTSDITNINAPIGKDAKKWTVVGKGTPVTTGHIGINNGKLYAWGTLRECNIGISSSTSTIVFQRPTQIHPDDDWIDCAYQNFAATSSLGDSSFSLFLKSSGMLYQCGRSTNGEFQLVTNEPKWAKVDCGNSFQGALTKNGLLYAWGNNNSLKLSISGISESLSPVYVNRTSSSTWPFLSHCIDFALGGFHGIAINTNVFNNRGGDDHEMPAAGTMFMWGNNNDYRAGAPSETDYTFRPLDSSGSNSSTSNLNFTACATVDGVSAIVRAGDELQTVGKNDSGATAQGTTTGNTTTFTNVSISSTSGIKLLTLTNTNVTDGTLCYIDNDSRFFYSGDLGSNPNQESSTSTLTELNIPNVDSIYGLQGSDCCGFILADKSLV